MTLNLYIECKSKAHYHPIKFAPQTDLSSYAMSPMDYNYYVSTVTAFANTLLEPILVRDRFYCVGDPKGPLPPNFFKGKCYKK